MSALNDILIYLQADARPGQVGSAATRVAYLQAYHARVEREDMYCHDRSERVGVVTNG